jgi:ribosomal protein L22
MTPSKPQDPDKGKAAEAEQVELEAKEAAAEAGTQAAEQAAEASDAPKPKRSRKKAEPQASEAEGTAAEVTGVDKPAAEAAAVTEPEPPEEAAAPEPKPQPKRPREAGAPVIVRAQARYVRSSPRKARLVCDAIRGKSVDDARAILAHHPRAVAEAWVKLLESAVANAENNHDLDGDDLRIHAVFADEGPTIKRFRPRAMGRATRIRKRTSHLTIQLTPKESTGSGTKRSR